MARLIALVLSFAATLLAVPAAAQSFALVSAPMVFVKGPVVQAVHGGQRIGSLVLSGPVLAVPQAAPQPGFVPRPAMLPAPGLQTRGIDRSFRDYRSGGIAHYGPFMVLDGQRAALVGETDAGSPRAFRAMLRAFPEIAQLDMVECPGTRDDRANLALGRLIRGARLATHVPPIGSVRSGAVELFLAGVERDVAEGAEFAVHSWQDEYGREAGDFGEDAPENRQYLDYYREMGLSEGQARAFYSFTNSVPHHSARWLDAAAMRDWLGRPAQAAAAPRLAYASL